MTLGARVPRPMADTWASMTGPAERADLDQPRRNVACFKQRDFLKPGLTLAGAPPAGSSRNGTDQPGFDLCAAWSISEPRGGWFARPVAATARRVARFPGPEGPASEQTAAGACFQPFCRPAARGRRLRSVPGWCRHLFRLFSR